MITSLTKYVDTVVTNYETTIKASNRTYITSTDIGTYGIAPRNYASWFPATRVAELNGTATTLYGQAM
jgi:hypothetical protein